ncbi:glycine dehydrogenase (aminomethyl-transferring) [Arthrobacter livingstonensis]|uniref:Glycine dehydrogenase (decarboxylating) n=1 Tax=Arthrobacter livingstonensis TaxID=670078 RepID=A0A2V5L6Q6_9MICC|nr:aminomethyl-transferring glycine dehydrogenase [Arthrobacter livingstonensis]PYI67059.1 glycine dehydrogenase (aminomethyl-transferring) [Arthrobacter livingstonensis]
MAGSQHPNSFVSALFSDRHIGVGAQPHVHHMLSTLGFASLEELSAAALPESIYTTEPLSLQAAVSEEAMLAELKALAAKNTVNKSFIGQGYYGTHTPGVIQRNVLESPAWYTAYTPYQPEISQGRLEALLNFQTVVADLTGMVTANASMLDEGTAAAEAVALMRRSNRTAAPDAVILVDADVFPQTLAVINTRAKAMGIPVLVHDFADDGALPDVEFFGLLLQYPGDSGLVRDLAPVIAAAKERKAVVAVAADLLALTLLESPGALGADLAVGTSQRFGVPMGFGGPHAGYMAVRQGLERSLPGRLVGVSKDAAGNQAYRLALQTREQHIRREKATSNICTAQVLLAVMAGMYAVYHGPEGLRKIATRVHALTLAVADAATAAGHAVVHGNFFDTVKIRIAAGSGHSAAELVAAAHTAGYLLRQIDHGHLQIAVDETTTEADVAALAGLLAGRAPSGGNSARATDLPADASGVDLPTPARATEYMANAVFHTHNSETQMLRYLRRLSDADYALDRGMIPLGSCTMKLNATAEMAAITWPEFSELHPFAPASDTVGMVEMATQLEEWLAEITGYDAVSVQPNAGSQGEFAGLMAIRAFHVENGNPDRDVVLIPTSAHGTNAASAVMAGLKVVPVATDGFGNIDIDDLKRRISVHEHRLAAIMVTYPSTHGVFETSISTICAMVHDAGGQVYVDGANLNALVGLARPGKFGADVSHLNLHKTFCIPHGGGGPGVGPVAVGAHLAKHLPARELGLDSSVGLVSSAPYGSASILPISWAYIRMMGPDGLRLATQTAILSANYIARRLSEHYPVLYTGAHDLVAHECILDLRGISADSGVSVDDVAKRLIDYGFHAPTMSFPVAGTLMVEPTESEDLGELDRFIDAMIAIRKEISAVQDGLWPAEDNPLANAPHTAQSLTREWDHPYSREEAVFPAGVDPRAKYWPVVRRVDQAYGDRHLVCSCPSIEELAEVF